MISNLQMMDICIGISSSRTLTVDTFLIHLNRRDSREILMIPISFVTK